MSSSSLRYNGHTTPVVGRLAATSRRLFVTPSPHSHQLSAFGFVRGVAVAFLALGGVVGLVGMNLPWFIFSSDMYHSEPSLLDGLLLIFTRGAWLLSVSALVLVVDALALFCAYRLLRGTATGLLLTMTCVLALVSLVGVLGVDELAQFFQLEPPFITPQPGAGQVLSLVGLVATSMGSLLWLLRARIER